MADYEDLIPKKTAQPVASDYGDYSHLIPQKKAEKSFGEKAL